MDETRCSMASLCDTQGCETLGIHAEKYWCTLTPNGGGCATLHSLLCTTRTHSRDGPKAQAVRTVLRTHDIMCGLLSCLLCCSNHRHQHHPLWPPHPAIQFRYRAGGPAPMLVVCSNQNCFHGFRESLNHLTQPNILLQFFFLWTIEDITESLEGVQTILHGVIVAVSILHQSQ